MTWVLLYIVAGHLHAVPDLPTLTACLRAAETVTETGAHSFKCAEISEISA